MVDKKKLYYRTNEYTYNFQNFRTINTFDRDIYNGAITLKEADLLVEILRFRKQVKPKNLEKNQKKKDALENLFNLFEGTERVLMLLIAKYFQ